MLPTEYGNDELGLNVYDRFRNRKYEHDSPPVLINFSNIDDIVSNNELIEDWKEASRNEIDRHEVSQYKIHHKPAFYAAATDLDYREIVRTQVFGQAN